MFCGFLCPFGLTQDIVYKLSEKIHLPKINRNEKMMKAINILSKIFLIFFLCGFITLTIFIVFFPSTLAKLNFPYIIIFVVIGIVSVILGLLARRLFCNFCPYGLFIGLFKKLNLFKVKKNCNKCSYCGACYESCPMKIKSIYLPFVVIVCAITIIQKAFFY